MQKIFGTVQQFIGSQYNIFSHRVYDYPTLFQQKLFIAFLEFQEILDNSHEDIIKILNSLNNKNLQSLAMGSLYSMMLYFSEQLSKQTTPQEQQKIIIKNQKAEKLNKYLKYLRNQSWGLINKLFIQLIQTHNNDIKFKCKFSIVKVFQKLQQIHITSEELLIIMLRTINIYEIDPFVIAFNLRMLQQLGKVIQQCLKFQQSQKLSKSTQFKHTQRLNQHQPLYNQTSVQHQSPQNFSQQKLQQQATLMCNYLFPKLFVYELIVHQMHFSNDKVLDQINKVSRSIVFKLYAFNPHQCLVFQQQILRYINFLEYDHQYESLVKSIKQNSFCSKQDLIQNKSLAEHHFQLLPLLSSIIVPIQVSRYFTILVQQTTSDKYNVHLILEWLWNNNSFLQQFKTVKDAQRMKQYAKYYRKEYSYLLVQVVRMIVTERHQSYQSFFILEWVLYKAKMACCQPYGNNNYGAIQSQSSAQNNIYSRIKQAFFNDWTLYLMNSNKFNGSQSNTKQSIIYSFNLLGSLQALNYLIYYSPNLAQDLLVHILLIQIKIANYNADQIRKRINLILKEANQIGILKIDQILSACSLSNHIKDQLSMRINQKLYEYTQHNPSSYGAFITNTNFASQKQPEVKKVDNLYETPVFYQNQQINHFQFSFNHNKQQNQNQREPISHSKISSEEDVLYSSHQYIHADEDSSNNLVQQEIKYELKKQQEQEPCKMQMQMQMQMDADNEAIKFTSDQCLQLQKQFVEQLGDQLTLILSEPTFVNFKQFLSKLLKVLKQYRKDSQNQTVQQFIFQASKVIYVMFNSHFEDYQHFTTIKTAAMLQNANSSIPQFFLKAIHDYWKQSISNSTILTYKKIVKCMVDNFASCEIRYYAVFINMFRKGVPYFKQMKEWLIVKQNSETILPIIQRIMLSSGKNLNLNFYENMQALKLK